MAQLSSLIAAFKGCEGPFPWRDFEKMLRLLGYEEMPKGKTGGSRRRYFNKEKNHLIRLHEPHGPELGPGTTKELRVQLMDRGII